ncbi:OTU domain-containing protein 6A [Chytriomyces hyalinus]|nr:OTU domain-containing protein 6A [Chytriomyces hyalinus]
MADSEQDIEELHARHRKETKELQGRITGMKKAASSDKKKKKELPELIAGLEADMKARHAQELADFVAQSVNSQEKDATADTEDCSVNEPDEQSSSAQATVPSPALQTKKPNRQQQRKAKKAANFEEQRRLAEIEAADTVDVKAEEDEAIQKMIGAMSLSVKQITADGHCLYSAVADQLSLVTQTDLLGYSHFRRLAAQTMRSNPDEFLPFLVNESGDMMDEDEYEKYCKDVESSATWGGQLEIKAMSLALKREIHVIQMGNPVLKIGEEFKSATSRPLMLSYHRHYYGLGEHYNSLVNRLPQSL